MRQLFCLFGSTALAATLTLTAAAQEYSNGGTGQKGRGPATMTPVEAFGVHPPGPDPADLNRCIFHRWACIFRPYYAPVSPTPSSIRWRPWCYFPLMPWYTPYYCGYCPKRLHNPPPQPYGSDGWGKGPMPGDAPCRYPLNYGIYSSVLKDDTIFWNMGGNGLVPYGTPRPPHGGPTDLVDMIQSSRPGGGGVSPASFNGAAGAQGIIEAGPAILPPTEKQDDKQPDRGDRREMAPPPKRAGEKLGRAESDGREGTQEAPPLAPSEEKPETPE